MAAYMSVPGSVDCCEVVGEPGADTNGPVRPIDIVIASGWIVARQAEIREVWIAIDGVRAIPAEMGLERLDVASHLGRPDLTTCGVRAVVPIDGLSCEIHLLTVEATDADGNTLRSDGKAYALDVTNDTEATAIAFIDEIRINGTVVDSTAVLSLAAASIVEMRGWIISAERRNGIAAYLRGDRLFPLAYGFERSDVVAVYGEGARYSGFLGTFDGKTLTQGGRRLSLVLLGPNGSEILRTCVILSILAID